MGGKPNRTSLEPPSKRVRTESESATAMGPLTPTPPGTPTHGSSSPATPIPGNLPAARNIQRSNSDMILESDDETTPPSGALHPEQLPLAEPSSESQTANPVVEPYEKQVAEETPMPPVQDLSLASPETRPNPFAASGILLHTPHALPSFVRATGIPDVGRLSLHSPALHDGRSRAPMVASHASWEESPTQRAYIFSAAEIRTLVASRGSDEGSGPNKLTVNLDWGYVNGITKWRNFKAGQG
jgi:hypothetical protein